MSNPVVCKRGITSRHLTKTVLLRLVVLPCLMALAPIAQATIGDQGFGSWNMQGASASTENKWETAVLQMMADGERRILHLQEAGQIPPSATNLRSNARFARPIAATYRNAWGLNYYPREDLPPNIPDLPSNTPTPPSAEAAVGQYSWGGTESRPFGFIYWLQTDFNGNRVNLAIVSRQQADEVIVLQTHASENPGSSARPALGLRFGDDFYFNVHARSSGTRNELPSLLNVIRNYVSSSGRADLANLVVAGDFNRRPETVDMNDGNWNDNLQLLNSGTPTQGRPLMNGTRDGSELDYAIVGGGGRNGLRDGIGAGTILLAVAMTILLSDHNAVYFNSAYYRR